MPGEDRDGAASPPEQGPAGEVYDWYVRGLELLGTGNPEAALQLLARVHREAPGSANVAEALARALFNAGRHGEAAAEFAQILQRRPDDDYARFGLGLARWRAGDMEAALTHLSMAVAMRPERVDYVRARDQVRATLRARADAGRGDLTSNDGEGA